MTSVEQMPLPKRYTVNLAKLGFANLLSLGRHDRTHADNDFVPHTHDRRRAEIAFLSRGRQSYLIDGRRHDLRGGDILLVRPGQSHSAGEVSQEKALLYWLIFEIPAAGTSFLTQRGAHMVRLLEAFRNVKHAHVPAPPGMRERFDAMIRLLMRSEEDRTLFSPGIYAHALLLIIDAVDAARRHALQAKSDWVAQVAGFIEAHIEEPVQVGALARRMGISTMRFTERFEREAGVLPSHYILRAKVEKAMREMRRTPDLPVTEIAFALGFSSSQYFATVFRRITGRTPSQFRRALVRGRTPECDFI